MNSFPTGVQGLGLEYGVRRFKMGTYGLKVEGLDLWGSSFELDVGR